MLQPMESEPPSCAPRLAASMMPGPPPVMIANPSLDRRRAVSTARSNMGSPGWVRAEPKNETAFRTSDSVSNPSTNSPMMRSTRQGSVLVNAARWSTPGTGGGASSSCSSSVTGLGCEVLERCDMVVPHVIEERGKAHVAGPGVRHDAGLGEASHRRERRRALLEAPRVVVQLEPTGVERELVLVPEPTRHRGGERAGQVLRGIEEHHAGA